LLFISVSRIHSNFTSLFSIHVSRSDLPLHMGSYININNYVKQNPSSEFNIRKIPQKFPFHSFGTLRPFTSFKTGGHLRLLCARTSRPQFHTRRFQTHFTVDWDSSVGKATRYDLDGPGVESRRRGEIFPNRPDRSWGPSSLLYNGHWVSFLGGGEAAGAWR